MKENNRYCNCKSIIPFTATKFGNKIDEITYLMIDIFYCEFTRPMSYQVPALQADRQLPSRAKTVDL